MVRARALGEVVVSAEMARAQRMKRALVFMEIKVLNFVMTAGTPALPVLVLEPNRVHRNSQMKHLTASLVAVGLLIKTAQTSEMFKLASR